MTFLQEELLQDLGKAYHKELHIERTLTTPKHYAYLKISEGCDRKCLYCAIPIITGRHVSRPVEEILDEVRYLVNKGVKEFQIIAQELTYYGVDLYKKQMLPELIERISEIPGVEWIRLHYAYPAHFPTDLFRVMRERSDCGQHGRYIYRHFYRAGTGRLSGCYAAAHLRRRDEPDDAGDSVFHLRRQLDEHGRHYGPHFRFCPRLRGPLARRTRPSQHPFQRHFLRHERRGRGRRGGPGRD